MSDQEDKSALKKNWAFSAIALFLGIGIVTLAVVDYIQSPPNHKGIEVGPIFIPIGPSKGSPTANQPNTHKPSGPGPGAFTLGLTPVGAYWNKNNNRTVAGYLPQLSGGQNYENVTWCSIQPTPGSPINWSNPDHSIGLELQYGFQVSVRLRI